MFVNNVEVRFLHYFILVQKKTVIFNLSKVDASCLSNYAFHLFCARCFVVIALVLINTVGS